MKLGEVTSNRYLARPPDPLHGTVDEITLFCGLARASLHYVITNLDQAGEAARNWYHSAQKKGKLGERGNAAALATPLRREALSKNMDAAFLDHLAKSIGFQTGTAKS